MLDNFKTGRTGPPFLFSLYEIYYMNFIFVGFFSHNQILLFLLCIHIFSFTVYLYKMYFDKLNNSLFTLRSRNSPSNSLADIFPRDCGIKKLLKICIVTFKKETNSYLKRKKTIGLFIEKVRRRKKSSNKGRKIKDEYRPIGLQRELDCTDNKS